MSILSSESYLRRLDGPKYLDMISLDKYKTFAYIYIQISSFKGD